MFKKILLLIIVLGVTILFQTGCLEFDVDDTEYSITYIINGQVKAFEPSSYKSTDTVTLPTVSDENFVGWYATSDFSTSMVIGFSNQIGDKVFFGKMNGTSTPVDPTDPTEQEDPTNIDNPELKQILESFTSYGYTFSYADGDPEYDYSCTYAFDFDEDCDYYQTTYEYEGDTYVDYLVINYETEEYVYYMQEEVGGDYSAYSSNEYDVDEFISSIDFIYPEGIDSTKFNKDGNVYHCVSTSLQKECLNCLVFEQDDCETFISFDIYVENNHISKIVIKSNVDSELYGKYNPVYTITFDYTVTSVNIPEVK